MIAEASPDFFWQGRKNPRFLFPSLQERDKKNAWSYHILYLFNNFTQLCYRFATIHYNNIIKINDLLII